MADDYDSPWKAAIERYFADFMHFYFPVAHARIDWTQPQTFLDQELRAVVRDAELGKRFVDKLARVSCQGGQTEWIYIHIEIQGSPQDEFAERMFVYHYRLYDRYRKPIASLAVLADDRPNWRPDIFKYEMCGCQMALRFPVAKLLDWAGSEAQLDDSSNPFAVLTLAHLATRATSNDMSARHAAKWRLVQGLYRRGFHRQQVIDLFKVIDWMMRLPREIEQQLRHDLYTLEEESKMAYISSIERLAAEEGIEQGIRQGMQQGRIEGKRQSLGRLLFRRFGETPAWASERLSRATEDELDVWADTLLSATTLESLLSVDRR